MQNRIDQLAELIAYHQDKYYNHQPEISDIEFDTLWDELTELAPDHPVLNRVGKDSNEDHTKREHLIPMGSQDKASSPEQFLRWAKKIAHPRYIVQYKLDGASIELQYHQGRFIHGVTRGDGRIGDDITRNVRAMQGVPQELPEIFSGAVRGEIIMEHRVHRHYYQEKANCRNAANGIMRRKDGAGSEHLRILCYDAISLEEERAFSDEIGKTDWLRRMGFDLVPQVVLETPEEVIHYRDLVIEKRSSLGYDIDGLVIKGPQVDREDMKRARPQKQIAFKFSAEEALTILRDVEWSESGHLYTPVALVDPVLLAGTTVRRASLVHPELIASMELRIGSEVIISKRGDIIPKIERLVRHTEETRDITPPEYCRVCGTATVNEGKRLYCPNLRCPRRAFRRLQKWIDVLEVRDFGDVLLGKLFETGLVREIADLYGLSVQDLSTFPGMGEVSASKALENLRRANPVPLARFVAGFDIAGIAELKMQKVVDAGFDTLEKIRAATVDDLSRAEGIAETTARAILEGLGAVRDEMDRLLATGTLILEEGASADAAGELPLKGMTFCFTGTLNRLKRSDAEKLVRRWGGESRSSVAAGLSRLVTNSPDSTSAKARRARELGVPVITEEDFLALLPDFPESVIAPGSQAD
ncbi:DNA ligase (NAD+) [Alkalispirochaeta americana]|uniref:DNA ligase n=1 Tax=Alkalispirochaeta americana TaxID=159291 RepID=A0A1N6P0C0_9SPIO|nr:NAD-dependent DNA ligase LigA [Alkalispirochaeta americana]SIP97726.1 DNA ligase (NAD+) [Alkalispirochaeta americana]